jgi:ribosomal protein S18 acetylase RimI-like enzyme
MIANTIIKRLELNDCHPEMLAKFNRYQEIERCWRKENGEWVLKDIAFVEQWDASKKTKVITSFMNCIKSGGSVVSAFAGDSLVAFSSIENMLFGSKHEYVNLDMLHVSFEQRRNGLGRTLFNEACVEAKRMGAAKLYISANSSEESVAFYRVLGCCEAKEINTELYKKEPFDVHMEYRLA